jgi:hypothetical protein
MDPSKSDKDRTGQFPLVMSVETADINTKHQRHKTIAIKTQYGLFMIMQE